ncbi:hypothetical protein DTO027I6_2339 [Penicillium roqueforti]|uniref:uncharacterized protein n=1 Tax=Penicillium roqueforti TaxID=5082 RepID=UPI00190E1C74|nr:uncharacterized protein LCP9604111_4571 [Penicillium roqueforti]KAF9249415.1 hypothetical protein LCP9604111_4571 [Penicillium roqueforti]KAI3174804.1 hypothetical protein DTO039G3_1962 [Penicillium roqueforti]KAI3217113.1 hypothetical protein DTO027I6_2339 [Penicillium roqueforti]KAI3247347.1 hypothetical protein DTO012A7_265 [Penicillium roqueforti]
MYGILKIGDTVISEYDELRRQLIRMNHTGIHILNFALREVLGGEVCQRGSLVAPEKLHFDFSHKSGLTEEDLKRVQVICHNYIKDDRQVFVADVTLENARRIDGVRTIVGETYPDPTRVVSIGVPVNTLVDNASKDWWNYSVELCGGAHVDRTGEIKDMVLLEESVIAKGVRRIAAATGQEVQEARQNAARLEEHLVSMEQMSISPEKEALVKQAQAELATSAISILDKKLFARRLEGSIKEMMKEQKETQRSQVDAAINHVTTVIDDNPASTSFVVNLPTDCSAKVITEAIKHVSSIHDDKSVYFIGVGATGRVAQGCFVSPKHTSNRLVANEWAAQVAKVVGGKGLTSMGSGPDKAKVEDGMVAARMYLQELRI